MKASRDKDVMMFVRKGDYMQEWQVKTRGGRRFRRKEQGARRKGGRSKEQGEKEKGGRSKEKGEKEKGLDRLVMNSGGLAMIPGWVETRHALSLRNNDTLFIRGIDGWICGIRKGHPQGVPLHPIFYIFVTPPSVFDRL